MKRTKKIASLALAAAIASSTAIPSFAAIENLVATDVAGKDYQYNLGALESSYLAYQINQASSGSALYKDFIKYTPTAFKDSVKGYVTVKSVENAYLVAQINKQSFNANQFTESGLAAVAPTEYIDKLNDVTVVGGEIVVTPVGEDNQAIAAALDAIDNAISAEEWMTALQNENLALVGVNETDADYETAYIEASSDFKFAADSQAESISDSVAAVQAVVNAVNARMDMNAATDETQMEAAVTAFIEAKLAVGNLDTDYIPLFEDYLGNVNFDDAERIAIAKMVLSVRNSTSGYGGLNDVVYHPHCNGIASVLDERESWIDGVNNALEEVDPVQQLTEVKDALNNIPTSLASDAALLRNTAFSGLTDEQFNALIDTLLAEYRYDPYYELSPENTNTVAASFITKAANTYPEGFTNLADILATLDEAIAELPAE